MILFCTPYSVEHRKYAITLLVHMSAHAKKASKKSMAFVKQRVTFIALSLDFMTYVKLLCKMSTNVPARSLVGTTPNVPIQKALSLVNATKD